MYDSKNKEAVEQFVKVLKDCVDLNGKVNWNIATTQLNEAFQETSKRDAWAKRYERLKFGNKNLTLSKKKEIKTKVKTVSMTDKKKTIIELMKYSVTLEALQLKTNSSKYEVLGMLKEIELEGVYSIKENYDGETFFYILERNLIPEKVSYSHAIGETKRFTFMVISDSHLGSKNEQLTFLHYLYDEAARRGIKNVYHCGDISEGFKKSRDDHMYSLHSIGFDDQADYIIRNYPERKNIHTYFITGNHDHFHIQNGGANIGKRITASRKDMTYLGINTAVIQLTPNCKMELFHPQDGSSYAVSYSGQKYLDSLSGGDKPNILFVGHHHKYISMWYRNVWYFEVPSTHLQSDWEKGKRIRNDSGALVVTVEVDSEGTLLDCNHSMIPHIKHIKDDWKSYAIIK
jgi:hypothetical protein